MKRIYNLLPFSLLILVLFAFTKWEQAVKPRVLVFSKTAAYRHESIAAGKTALIKLGKENGIIVDTTENENYFNDDSLKNYSAVIFLSTTGNILNSPQQISFERFIQAGGGYAGIHAAADTEYDWEWYGKLAGGYFKSHPKIQDATMIVNDRTHLSTKHLDEKWTHKDEWYNYKNLNQDVKVLISLDEKTYTGGENGDYHPIAWYHEFDGGRAFYTGMGHTNESYSDQLFLKHLLGGIKYAIGNNVPLNYAKAKTPQVPEENRFVKTVLTTGTLYEPTEMAILPNLDILLVQRRGEIMLYKQKSNSISQVGFLNAYHKTAVSGVNAEEGVLGIAADPAFKENNYVYIFYSPIDTSVNRLSRFKFVNDKLDNTSEKVILEFYSQREICCHTGGSIAFGPDGLLYVSAGDNATPFDVPKQTFVNKGYGPLDNRPGLEQYDARRSSGNTNDLRGKIMRIKVNEDGTYSIPEGNLFPPNTPGTKPEIYVMGNRNPYRISIDSKTGFLYWGEVGPDANADSPERGSRGYDELNQARKAGFFGWPFFVGNNYPYRAYDYTTGTAGEAFDPAKPHNNSPNNTGLEYLPSVSPAFIWYPYAASKEFPQVGTGGRNAMAGPVYHTELYPKETRYPDYYNNKLFIYDWIRGWIKAVTMKPNGDYDNMEAFMPMTNFSSPIDMELGPDGRIYILEYGKGWFSKNPDAGISRIDFVAGNRPPKIKELIVSKTSGVLPFKLQAKVEASDPDKDKMNYVWELGNGIKKSTVLPSIEHTFTKAGEYAISVLAIDKNFASTNSSPVTISAGNAQPKVSIQLKGNQSFYFAGKAVEYDVSVSDEGSAVNKSTIYVANNYTKGSDLAGASMGHQVFTEAQAGQALMLKSDCQSCHQVNTKSIGPSYTQVSAKYQNDPSAATYLAAKIIKGGSGTWGEVAMPAHSAMSDDDARKIAQWVLSLENKAVNKASLPIQGSIIPEQESENNIFSIYASYTDQGQAGLKPLTGTATVYLRSNIMSAREITERTRIGLKDSTSTGFLIYPQNNGWLKLSNFDLSGIRILEFANLSKGGGGIYDIEIRANSETGALLGKGNFKDGEIPDQQSNTLVQLNLPADMKINSLFVVFVSDPKNLKPRPLLKTVTFKPE